MRYLVTGGAGFIGSNFVHHLMTARPQAQITNLDALTYAGNLDNLAGLDGNPRYSFIKGDICDQDLVDDLLPEVDVIVHIAAESHVDRSILDAAAFIRTNVEGTQRLLDGARKHGIKRFLHVSTDEVYGSLGHQGRFTEASPLAPNSPYSASKAASDLLVRAAFHTHGVPAVITRCTNNYGPYQFPEKFIPLVISNALEGQAIPVYGTGENVRNWIHVQDHCTGILAALEKGTPGEVYNLGSDDELDNLALVRMLLRLLNRPESLIRFVADRPGHDFRYSLDSSFARRALDWQPATGLETGLRQTVDWYLKNQEWIHRVRSGEFRKYYDTQYSVRVGAPGQEGL